MLNNNRTHLTRCNILKILSPAIVIYGAFLTIRLMGYQPPTESGLGDFITALFFLFGASVAYFVFLLHSLGELPPIKPSGRWWYFSGAFLSLLAFDEIFMIHEYVCWWLEIRDIYLFMIYGMVLSSLIFIVRHQLTRIHYCLLAAFVILAGTAVISDTVMGEGMITILNRPIGFEQIAESFSAFSLASAFVALGVRQLLPHLGRSLPTDAAPQSRDLVSDHITSAK